MEPDLSDLKTHICRPTAQAPSQKTHPVFQTKLLVDWRCHPRSPRQVLAIGHSPLSSLRSYPSPNPCSVLPALNCRAAPVPPFQGGLL